MRPRVGPRGPARSPAALLAAALLLVEAIALYAWTHGAYWEFSDGVYAETARALLHGAHLYSGVAAAQPPPVYLAGAALLAVHDGVAAIRIGLGAVNLIAAGLVGACVWRLTGRATAAIVAALLAPLLPISLHEHAQLVPETLAAPLLLAGALLGAERRWAMFGGVLLAAAAACKLAFLLPAVLVLAAAAHRRRALAGFAVAALLAAAATLLVFGGDVLDEIVVAQMQTGTAALHGVAGTLAQAAWNEWPLVLLAVLALVVRRDLADAALLRTLAAAAVGGLLLGLTLFKRGSAIDVLVVAEPPLLALAVAGLACGWRRREIRPGLIVAAAVVVAQAASLLLDPGAPGLARRPLARSGLEYRMSAAAVREAVRRARACPEGAAYSGEPYLAFVAGRRMPGDQPDVFIIGAARTDARFARRAQADRPTCP